MPRKAKEMTALEVRNMQAPGLHFVGGVSGLALRIAATGGRSWILRVVVGNKRRDIGLGGFPDVQLTSARESARQLKAQIQAGTDPVEQRQAKRSKLRAAQAKAMSFQDAAKTYIETHRGGWSNPKHAAQWTNTLDTYAHPKLGHLQVKDIELSHVMSVLKPIWDHKTETASRLRGRIEAILDWATVQGLREGLNPARWRGHLDHLLQKPSRIRPVKHHDALPIDEVPGFFQELRTRDGNGARALELLIFTATRFNEIRGARWSEFDLEQGLWVISAERMKARRPHRVALSDAALALLRSLPRVPGNDLVFPGSKNKLMSDNTLRAVTLRITDECSPHGFRSSFRDWAAERTSHPSDMVEMALAHAIGNKVEAAYRRGDMLERRRALMNDWARFCETGAIGGSLHVLRSPAAGTVADALTA